MADSRRPRQTITRLVDGRICAYDLATDLRGPLAPAAVWQPSPEDEVVDHAATADLQRAYYTTLNAVVCVRAEGAELWRSSLNPKSSERHGHRPGCVLSLDESTVWVYRPDAMAGRDRTDQWVALDAGSGAVVGQVDLGTVGHGGVHMLHETSGQVLLDVGEGQDGSVIFRGSLTDTGIDLSTYPWDDRCLIDLSPDGCHFMTVDHTQGDAAVHVYPGGEVAFSLTVEDFGHDPDQDYVEWSGGYLSPGTVLVTVGGETEDEQEWFRHYRVDARSGRIQGEFDAKAQTPYDLRPLGDGTWLTTDPSGHPVRWASLEV